MSDLKLASPGCGQSVVIPAGAPSNPPARPRQTLVLMTNQSAATRRWPIVLFYVGCVLIVCAVVGVTQHRRWHTRTGDQSRTERAHQFHGPREYRLHGGGEAARLSPQTAVVRQFNSAACWEGERPREPLLPLRSVAVWARGDARPPNKSRISRSGFDWETADTVSRPAAAQRPGKREMSSSHLQARTTRLPERQHQSKARSSP
jgi:hypothetical protein